MSRKNSLTVEITEWNANQDKLKMHLESTFGAPTAFDFFSLCEAVNLRVENNKKIKIKKKRILKKSKSSTFQKCF